MVVRLTALTRNSVDDDRPAPPIPNFIGFGIVAALTVVVYAVLIAWVVRLLLS